jgi:uncharacterized repeat protein (TIGR04042 family)
MPEMTFTVRWPDGRDEHCYSPSLVMHDYLAEGTRYTVADFTALSSQALAEASERVRARFGFACTSAAATVAQIEGTAARFHAQDLVEVVAMDPPLPEPVQHDPEEQR